MQARLEIHRFPTILVAVVLAAAAALLVGLGLGYSLKAIPVAAPAPTQAAVDASWVPPSADACIRVDSNSHKGC